MTTKQRTFTIQLLRFCRKQGTYQPLDQPICAWQECDHRLPVKKMFVCDECEQAYLDRDGFDGHECGDAV